MINGFGKLDQEIASHFGVALGDCEVCESSFRFSQSGTVKVNGQWFDVYANDAGQIIRSIPAN